MTVNLHAIDPSPTSANQLAIKACRGVKHTCAKKLLNTAGIYPSHCNIHDHHSESNLYTQLIMAALTLREETPEYDIIASRILLRKLASEVELSQRHTDWQLPHSDAKNLSSYQLGFLSYIEKGINLGLIRPEIIAYDLPTLAGAITASLDSNLTYVELQHLSSQLLMRHDGQCFELPQYAFLRIAISLAMKENKSEDRVVEIYRLLSVRSFSRISAKIFSEGTTLKGGSILNRNAKQYARPHTPPNLKLVN